VAISYIAQETERSALVFRPSVERLSNAVGRFSV
jgi:hypothetical protein